ncbi:MULTISPECIES: M23 family metallopeptidase [unclassified Pseudodesulfovibrio]|uniref:M23 family metallopeptidase n=1 Tax=unclassified Pseudodesulfovibrio TaxID=2661612 RepID=UPI000FEB76E7|nr:MULTISPECIES: M23 family metallopeptidase [unclassified Pseudodesulfovibrio]MCJ2164484.1 M23 family metallopeptidase [Pseudodesulfovibrio sp. S3-i]RWU04684.1 M23 family peptidase [Pseudodesulfovibrio sp. S3]
MKRFFLSLFLVVILALPMIPVSGTAQDFGLQEGDDIGLVLPKDASAASEAAPVHAGSALILAAPGRVGVGQPFLVRLTSDQPLDSVSVHWLGKEVVPSISVWNNRHVALVMLGTDVIDAKPGKQDLSVIASVDGKENTLRRSVQVTSVEYPKQELTLPPGMVTPPQDVYDRIAAERELTTAAKNTVSAQRLWRLPLERPVEGEVSSLYGLKRILNGTPKNPHRGQDLRSPMGNPVKAAADGVVILVGDHYYAGNSVYIDHGNGVVTMYFHLSKPIVKEGDKVQRGQAIGLSGQSGRATGPHLHFSVSVLGKLVDPAPLFKNSADNMLQ